MLATYEPIKYNVDIDLFDLNVTSLSKAGNIVSHERIITQGNSTLLKSSFSSKVFVLLFKALQERVT